LLFADLLSLHLVTFLTMTFLMFLLYHTYSNKPHANIGGFHP